VTTIKRRSSWIKKVNPSSGSLVNAKATLDGKSKEALPDPSGEFVMISHRDVRERDINLEGCGWVALHLLI
jgi:hypothetical protein